MLPYFREQYGNPASEHFMGRQAAKAVEKAREQVADLLRCDATEIIFTAGATEGNNLVIRGARSRAPRRTAIVTSLVEHKSVLGPCDDMEAAGRSVLKIPVTGECLVDIGVAERLVSSNTLLVSVQAANNEVGTIQPVKELANIARSKGALFHCDAAQALGKIPFDVRDIGMDFASFSAHKLYGPKGVGALYIRGGVPTSKLQAAFAGGGQEAGLRPGTLNVPAIVGMGEACRLAKARLAQGEAAALSSLRDYMEELLVGFVAGAVVNGGREGRLPGTTNLTLPQTPADALIANVPAVCFSSGSACTSGSLAPSHVLLAMGRSWDEARCSIRLAVGRHNSRDEIRNAAHLIRQAVQSLWERLQKT
jgi:cysteine desulfurase